MARKINQLSAAQVAKETRPGRYGDGNGLWLQVSQYGTKAWIFRFMMNGRARQMGLGSVDTFSLKEARERARAARQLVADGIDPIEARNERKSAARANEAKRVTFADAAARYIKDHAPGWRSAKHADQWTSTLDTYAKPVIGELSVADVDTAHVMKVLERIWTEKPETAGRVRGRMEAVLDWAKARHYRTGDNPARWKGHLDHLLPAKSKVAKVRHMPALPYAELPAFMGRLDSMDSISARALEFTILTAVRTNETIGAKWGEIDLEGRVWIIPADRMKASREHRVPLTDRALEILRTVPREEGNEYVFPGGRRGRGLSNMAMLELLRGMDDMDGVTVHGFRSTFRVWAEERTSFPSAIAEAALAHTLKDKTEAAYQRSDLLEKRRRLMTAWAKFCSERPARAGDNVIAMQARV
jgi:integrase